LIPVDETNHVEIVSEEDLATQDDEYYDTMSESIRSFDAWDNEDIQVKDNQDLDWKVSFDDNIPTSNESATKTGSWVDF